MYREAPGYSRAKSYGDFCDDIAQVPDHVVKTELDLRFDDSAKHLFDSFATPELPEEELRCALNDFTMMAKAADTIYSDEPTGQDALPGWLVKARRKLLDVWQSDYDGSEQMDPRSTPYFDDAYATRKRLIAVCNSHVVPKFTYDDEVFAAGAALGRIGITA